MTRYYSTVRLHALDAMPALDPVPIWLDHTFTDMFTSIYQIRNIDNTRFDLHHANKEYPDIWRPAALLMRDLIYQIYHFVIKQLWLSSCK